MKYKTISSLNLNLFFIKIVVYSLKIIGLASFSIKRSAARDNTQARWIELFRYSKVGTVYNLLLIIPVPIGAVLNIQDDFDSVGDEYYLTSSIKKIIIVVREITAVVASCLLLISWGLRQRKAATILNLLIEVCNRLSALKQQPTEKRSIVSFMIHLAIHTVLWIIVPFDAREYIISGQYALVFLTYFPILVIFFGILEYSGIVSFVAGKFRTVNQSLTNYQDLTYLSRPPVRNNPLIVASLITRYDDQLTSIRLLRNVRATLVDLCKDIDDFYSLAILFCIFYSYVSLFYDIYYIFMNDGGEGSDSPAISVGMWTLLTIVMCAYPVTSLALNVTRVKAEAALTGKIVNKLIAATRKESEVRFELKQFSRDVLCDDDNVFTAYGLFSLDSTLLPSILASAITYFIVLIQLQPPSSQQEPFCNCSTHP